MTRSKLLLLATMAVSLSAAAPVKAETWAVGTATTASWADTSSWVEGTIPNAVGATAIFNTPTVATGTRNIDLNGDYTVGSITFNNAATNSVTQNIRNATDGVTAHTLTFDAPGAGPVTVTVSGNAATNSRMQSDMLFNDDVVFNITNTVGNATGGALSLTGNITGPGGLTKSGDGLMTTAFNAGATGQVKQWSGPTFVNGGRWRMSVGGVPSLTSSVTINGGQITPIASGTYTYGTGSLLLSGAGPTSGPYAAFAGVIRPDTNFQVVIPNSIVLQAAATLHMQGSATGKLTLSGAISGSGVFIAGAAAHDANVGQIVFDTSTNSYSGGTSVNVGALVATGSTTNAFGAGAVRVESASAAFGGSSARAVIQAGATNAIANTAYLSLAGGNVAGTADDGYIDLDSGINETVGGLMLGNTIFGAGTYGSLASGAANPGLANPDEYFAGLGTITVVPSGVPGDYNGNGLVDGADFVVWRNGGPLQNDFTPGVQASDYDFWRSRFGATTNPGSGSGLGAAAVPEPTSLALLGLLLVLVGATRGARRAINA